LPDYGIGAYNNVEVAEAVKIYEDGDAGEQEGTASES